MYGFGIPQPDERVQMGKNPKWDISQPRIAEDGINLDVGIMEGAQRASFHVPLLVGCISGKTEPQSRLSAAPPHPCPIRRQEGQWVV